MPFFIFALLVTTIGGVAYGTDQHNKRIAEQAAAREALARLERHVTALQAQLWDLERRYGRMNQQYRELAHHYLQASAELEKLRASVSWAQVA
jgi:chromosome segregation ATPase